MLRLFHSKTLQFTDVKTSAVGLFLQSPTSSFDSDFIINRDLMLKSFDSDAMTFFLIKTDQRAGALAGVTEALRARFKNGLPFRIDSTDTVYNADANSLTSLNLTGLGALERLFTLLVISLGMAVFQLAMINQRQREFGAMRALGATVSHLRRFLFAEAATIGGLSLLIMLLGVIFTVPTATLEIPWLELGALAALVAAGMAGSTLISSRRLATLRVVESLREL